MTCEHPLRTLLAAIGIALLGAPACSPGDSAAVGSKTPSTHLQSGSVADRALPGPLVWSIRALVEGSDAALGNLTDADREALRELYRRDNYRPLWSDASGRPSGNARTAVGLLVNAADEGLDPDDYHQSVIGSLTSDPGAQSGPTGLARFDVAVSSGMMRYLRHLHVGRVDPRAIGFRLATPRDSHDFPALLLDAIDGNRLPEAAVELRPPLAQYQLLREQLVRYRSLTKDPTLAAPLPSAAVVHPGDAYAGAGLLFRRLVAFGDVQPDEPPPVEDGPYAGVIVDGVKRFQLRQGLEPDGILGTGTWGALRVPISWRVRQIELALERLRWLPHLGDERLVALNIPMFRLWAWDTIPASGSPLFGMDVIVGRALNTQTPVFVEEMREVVFRPYWNVPSSILRHEVLPKLASNQDYLRRESMEIVRGSGDNASPVELTAESVEALRQGKLRVRQRPGPTNALGLIKFVFPNQEDVYMHGTPAQVLFAKARRDFSHGCVRVEDPVRLAEWLLQDRPEWTRDRIVAATMGTQTVHVKLAHPIQVVLFYTTAAVMPEDNTIRFADDIYHHDVRLDRALTTRQAGY